MCAWTNWPLSSTWWPVAVEKPSKSILFTFGPILLVFIGLELWIVCAYSWCYFQQNFLLVQGASSGHFSSHSALKFGPSRIAGKCLPHLQETSTHLIQTLPADRAWLALQLLPKQQPCISITKSARQNECSFLAKTRKSIHARASWNREKQA